MNEHPNKPSLVQPNKPINQPPKSTLSTLDTYTLIFGEDRVEIRGTPNDLLFNSRDIARNINDLHNYDKKLKLLKPKDIIKMTSKDIIGRNVDTTYLTEIGMYRYLMQSKRPEAEEFQYSIYEKMVEMRKQVISDEQLKIRILTGKLETATSSNHSMVLGEFRRNLDTSPEDLANFCIAKFFARDSLTYHTPISGRESLSPMCIKLINKLAGQYFYEDHLYPELEEKIELIIDNQQKFALPK